MTKDDSAGNVFFIETKPTFPCVVSSCKYFKDGCAQREA